MRYCYEKSVLIGRYELNSKCYYKYYFITIIIIIIIISLVTGLFFLVIL
jgi:hypothetical protein